MGHCGGGNPAASSRLSRWLDGGHRYLDQSAAVDQPRHLDRWARWRIGLRQGAPTPHIKVFKTIEQPNFYRHSINTIMISHNS
jgi:hypothetical protein